MNSMTCPMQEIEDHRVKKREVSVSSNIGGCDRGSFFLKQKQDTEHNKGMKRGNWTWDMDD